MTGANCGSDHELLIAKFRLKLKKVGKTTRRWRYDLNQTPFDYTVEVILEPKNIKSNTASKPTRPFRTNTQKKKKDLHDLDNHDGVITHLEPDILECEVKWALESITMNKASGGDGIPVKLFQILKDDAVKLLHSLCQQIWKTQQWPQDWKRSVFIPIPKKGNAKECSNYRTIALISYVSKVMLKVLQARLQQ